MNKTIMSGCRKACWIIAAAIGMGLTSCADDTFEDIGLEPSVDGKTPIAFGCSEQSSRATATNLATVKNTGFGVYAYEDGVSGFDGTKVPDYFCNEKIYWETTGTPRWTYTPIKYWNNQPDQKISFFAYAPYVDASSLTSKGVTSIPNKNSTGDPLIGYTITGTTPANQVDLVYANALNKGASDGKVNMNFKHAMSFIKFSAKKKNLLNTDPKKIKGSLTINSIKIKTIDEEGEDYHPLPTTGNFNLRTGEWQDKTNGSYSCELKSSDNALQNTTITSYTTYNQISKDDKFLMLIPVRTTDDDPNSRASFEIIVNSTITEGGTVTDNTVSCKLNVDLVQGYCYDIWLDIYKNGVDPYHIPAEVIDEGFTFTVQQDGFGLKINIDGKDGNYSVVSLKDKDTNTDIVAAGTALSKGENLFTKEQVDWTNQVTPEGECKTFVVTVADDAGNEDTVEVPYYCRYMKYSLVTGTTSTTLPFADGTYSTGDKCMLVRAGNLAECKVITTINDSSREIYVDANTSEPEIEIWLNKNGWKMSYKRTRNVDGNSERFATGSFDKNVKEVQTPVFYPVDCERLFYECSKLTKVPANVFDYCEDITDFSGVFEGCSALTEIPAGLFDNCTKAKYFGNPDARVTSRITTTLGAFKGCKSLTEIPAGLFDNCSEAMRFSYTFQECDGITEIPAGLFDNCTKVTDFSCVFYDCYHNKKIPAGLFDSCTEVTDFTGAFYNNREENIPDGLFDNCTKVTSFANAFDNNICLTAIPEGLFDNCTKVTDIGFVFFKCTQVTEIPAGLFDNCTKIDRIRRAFSGCTGVTNAVPRLWDRTKWPNVTHGTDACKGCYFNCRNASNYSSIPDHCKIDDYGHTAEWYDTHS